MFCCCYFIVVAPITCGGLCFVIAFAFFLALKSSRLERESRLFYFNSILAFMYLLTSMFYYTISMSIRLGPGMAPGL